MKIKRIIIGILLTAYLIVAVFLTVCLLSYNQYNISEFGDKSFVIVKNDDFEPDYKKGTLLIVTKNKNEEIKVNDDIFFYNKYKNQIAVSHSKVTRREKLNEMETTFTITGDYLVSSENVIGKADTAKVINGVGSVLAFLESRWGFLFIIVLPISVIFIYEIYIIVKEIAKPEEDEQEKVIKVVKEEPEQKPEEEKVEVKTEENTIESKESELEQAKEQEEVKEIDQAENASESKDGELKEVKEQEETKPEYEEEKPVV